MSVIEKTRRPLQLRGSGTAASRGSETRLPKKFVMEPQLHINWCWAAVAASVAAYYKEGPHLSQCQIANLELESSDCCERIGGSINVDCNVPNVFASPLNRVGCFAKLARFKQASFEEVRQELQAGRPICVRTVWLDGGAHFVAIVGCWSDDKGTPMLAVDDPFWGRSEYSYDRFSEHYQLLGGKWNDTYYTKSP